MVTDVDRPSGAGVQEIAWTAGHGSTCPKRSLYNFLERNVHQIRTVPVSARGQHRVRTYTVEGFTLLHAVGTGESRRIDIEVRDREQIDQDGKDRFGLMMQLKGDRVITQLGRSQHIRSGGSALYCTSEPYVIETDTWSDRYEGLAFLMPSEFVNQRVFEGKQYCLRAGAVDGGLLNLVSQTMQLFAREAWDYSQENFYRAARVMADLILAGLRTPMDRAETALSVRLSNLEKVKAIVHRRMEDPDLTLTEIAAAAGFSLNYLHNLFRDQGQTLYGYLKGVRLQSARELLQLAGSRGLSVTDVCLSCGFSDAAYFSRSFKQAFGMSPRDALRRC